MKNALVASSFLSDVMIKNGSLMSGQIAGLVDEIRPVADIFKDLYTGAQSVISGLQDVFE